MSAQRKIGKCIQCDNEVIGQFCSNCGKAQSIKRIDGQYILSEIRSVLNLEKGIFFTIKELLLRPGINIQKFIIEDRNRLVKPIVFIIICSLVYTLMQQGLNFEDGYVNYSFSEESTATIIFRWLSNNYGYTNILIAIFIAFWIKIFFRKHNYNFFEILILLCFVIGVAMLIFSFFGIIDRLISLAIIDKGFLIGVLYISWAIGRFFQKGKIGSYVKGFFSYMLGVLSFTLVVMALGAMIDWIK